MYKPKTIVSIRGDDWCINGEPTYKGRFFKELRVEGLLLNSRMANGIFDDLNCLTQDLWSYVDTGMWDAERNTKELTEMFPVYWRYGLRAISVNMQGGSPLGYYRGEEAWISELARRVKISHPRATNADIWEGLESLEDQPWNSSGFTSSGEILPGALGRLQKVIERADKAGLVICLGLFYFGQDNRIKGEEEIRSAVKTICQWILDSGYRNVIIEINNEADIPRYSHEILTAKRVHELIYDSLSISDGDHRLLVGTSFTRRECPSSEVLEASDFILLHGNGVDEPSGIAHMVERVRLSDAYRGQPIVFNEDDHFEFDSPRNNFLDALESRASWGYFDPAAAANGGFAFGNYTSGFQNPPINWTINTRRKREFFNFLKQVVGN